MPPLNSTGHANPLVDFLRTYGPSADSHSIWDEHVLAEAARTGVAPIEVPSEKLAAVVGNFKSEKPVSVVLTGTAGDGKTWLCRRIFHELGGTMESWERSGPMLELPLGSRCLVVIKDLSQFHDQPELPGIMARVLPALLGDNDDEVFLVAANDGQLLRFWRDFARTEPQARQIEERIRVLLKDDRSEDADLRMQMHNLSRQPHDVVFDNVVEAISTHPAWKGCVGCDLLEGPCPIRRNLAVLANTQDPGMRIRLRNLIRLAAYNDNHLPIRHVLMLAVNIVLGVSGKANSLMRCGTAHTMAAAGTLKESSPYDNALGLNLPDGSHDQYRAFTVFEDMGIGRETNNVIDSILVDAQPEELYTRLMRADPVFGNGSFENTRLDYQRGRVADFRAFGKSVEQQRRRLFFAMPRDPSANLDPWELTIFSHGGEYLDFVSALERKEGKTSIDFVRWRLVVGLNRSYTGAMCDESQQVWFASPAANTQSRLGRVLDVEVPVGKSRRYTYYFDFESSPDVAYGRPAMVVRLTDGKLMGSNAITPLLFEYLLRVQAGSLPGSFSRQCFEELRQFRLRVVAALSGADILQVDALEQLCIIRVGADGALRQEAIEVLGSI